MNIYIEMWNADTNEWEWREFSTKEIDELMEMGIIDEDTLGYAMKDLETFESIFEEMDAENRPFTFCEFVERYIKSTGEEIRIAR